MVETLTLIGLFVFCLTVARTNKAKRLQALILGFGLVLFFGIYIFANAAGDITLLYDINLVGPLGMLAFLATITFLIVRFHAFNMRVLGAQALILTVSVFLFAALFVRTIENARYVLIATLVLVAILGMLLIRGVRREVEQRQRIEKLARELELTNQRQESLIHFISHEVKGYLTKDMSAFAALSEGDLGPLPEPMKPFIEGALVQSREGAAAVIDILQASNLKKGTVIYKKDPVDVKTLVEKVVTRLKPIADKKALTLTFLADEAGAPYSITGDAGYLGDHVLRNIIENSINYTPTGTVTVSLKKQNGKVIFAVQDTGVGITDEDKKKLFTEGGHGKDSLKVNVHSSGYGLFIAKNIVEAHGGTIRAESDGPGKGSTFTIELPAA